MPKIQELECGPDRNHTCKAYAVALVSMKSAFSNFSNQKDCRNCLPSLTTSATRGTRQSWSRDVLAGSLRNAVRTVSGEVQFDICSAKQAV